MARKLIFVVVLLSLGAARGFAHEESFFARVTAYWPGEGEPRACSNGARLRPGHCAVDPNKIPYGSKVYFPDGPCLAVDTGPAVVNRKAARLTGRTARERNALVIDRYFDSKEKALAWLDAHPHFMTVRIVAPRSLSKRMDHGLADGTNMAQTSASPRIAQTIAAPAIEQTAGPSSIACRELDWPAASTVHNAAQALLSAPPSYHRRRFAADAKEDTVVAPARRGQPVKLPRAV